MEHTNDTQAHVLVATGAFLGRILIAADNGPYPGCRPELDVRRIGEVAALTHLRLASPAVAAIMARDNGYGCCWGESSRLYPLSATDEADLIAAQDAARIAAEAAKAANIAAAEAQDRSDARATWMRRTADGGAELTEDC